MSAEAPIPPVSGSGGGRLPVCEKPQQKFEERWWLHMEPLPSQVLRPMRDAFDGRLSAAHRRARVLRARQQLEIYSRDLKEWMQSVDHMLQRHGEPFVDKLDSVQADSFHASLTDSERKALAKCQRVRAAIAYGNMTLEWLDWELSRGD